MLPNMTSDVSAAGSAECTTAPLLATWSIVPGYRGTSAALVVATFVGKPVVVEVRVAREHRDLERQHQPRTPATSTAGAAPRVGHRSQTATVPP
jgi:hypothetical protein